MGVLELKYSVSSSEMLFLKTRRWYEIKGAQTLQPMGKLNTCKCDAIKLPSIYL